MPYTPPASQSPVTSRPQTPSLSRTHSYNKFQTHGQLPPKIDSRPELPHSSSSYLHRHRRSPSISKSNSFLEIPTVNGIKSEETREEGKAEVDKPIQPVATNGEIISSTESTQTSSEDEINTEKGEVRDLANLAELQAAIRVIEQHRASSPDRTSAETNKARVTNGIRFSQSTKDSETKTEAPHRLPLSAGARKISHSRSNTDGNAHLDCLRNKFDSPARSQSDSDAEEVEDDELRIKPPMVRKKSGELVRPALRPSTFKRRPSSMPGTPTFSKAVHFDSSLEHVRHFLQVDRPIAVSAGSSPVESTYDEEIEFPFGNFDNRSKSLPFEWEIQLPNYPAETPQRNLLPVKVERVYLSSDNKNLIGAVAASNIAFHKLVVVRFTLDYWKTTSEVVADYNNDIRRKQINDGYDRFVFSIKLEDQANLENKTMFFCVRYNVNGQEFWDNNHAINYQVEFSKKPKFKKGNNARPLNALPRSNASPNLSPRPRSMPNLSDDFSSSSYEFSSFPQPSTQIIGDSPTRFRNNKSLTGIIPDAPGRRANPASQAFGNRYDFGASLSAAIQGSGSSANDRGGVLLRDSKSTTKQFSFPTNSSVSSPPTSTINKSGKVTRPSEAESSTTGGFAKSISPIDLAVEKPPLQSSSYTELLDKYCFVRSKVGRDGKGNVC